MAGAKAIEIQVNWGARIPQVILKKKCKIGVAVDSTCIYFSSVHIRTETINENED